MYITFNTTFLKNFSSILQNIKKFIWLITLFVHSLRICHHSLRTSHHSWRIFHNSWRIGLFFLIVSHVSIFISSRLNLNQQIYQLKPSFSSYKEGRSCFHKSTQLTTYTNLIYSGVHKLQIWNKERSWPK